MIRPLFTWRTCSLLVATALLPVSLASAAEKAATQASVTLRPEHQEVMQDWGKSLRAMLRLLETPEQDKETLEGIATIRGLIDLPRLEMDKAEPLVGTWRVRSLQVNNLGAYTYPFFTCKISQKNGALEFHKATGSQRKLGILERQAEDHYRFIGAVYYGYEEVRHYSTMLSNPTEEDRERDSIGHLYKLGKNHYLMVFAPEQGRCEINEIKK